MIRKVLVVDPDSSSQQRCARLLRDCRCEATLVDSVQGAKRRIVEHKFDAAIVDFQLASTKDFDLPAAAQRAGMRVIVTIDALQTPPDRSPLQLRGCALLTRPLKIEELTRALDADELSPTPVAPVASSRKHDAGEFAGMVGSSEKMQRIFRLVSKVAVQRHPVLILGESGSGKELVARAIHDLGPLRDRPFVPIDCGALPPTLIESELFGHVKGAFTGAAHARDGMIASADSGTVFFDELGELPLELQSRLLRALQEHEIRPIGGNQAIKFEARVIAATNQDLEARIKTGTFRKDLYFRVNVVTIKLPALRERAEDIPALVRHFIERHDPSSQKLQLGDDALDTLRKYSWNGNIRELENVIQSLITVSSRKFIGAEELPSFILYYVAHKSGIKRVSGSLEALERQAIFEALKKTGGDRLRAAGLLGIGKTTIYRKLKEYGIESSPAQAAEA